MTGEGFGPVGHIEPYNPVVAYVRVSSRAQDDATQRRAIEGAARARGDVVVDWRAEKRSGRTLDRPELQRLLADARSGALRGRRLYVYRIDRLTRSGIADTLRTLEELRAHGVDVQSAADGFDLAGPQAEVIIAVMAWAAKMERLATNERIADARERVEAEGGRWGRPPRMTPADIARARQMLAEGRTLASIAMGLGVPRTTVQRSIAAARKDAAGEPRPSAENVTPKVGRAR